MASQLIDGRFRGETDAGLPLVGGMLYTYASGTNTPKPAYTDSTLTTATTNPIILNARGEAQVWLGAGVYSLKLTDAQGVPIWTADGVSAADSQGAGQAAAAALAADLASTAAGKGAAMVGFPGRVSLLDKIRDLLHIKDYGGLDVGTTDESAAESAGMTAATARRGILGSLWMWKFPRRGIKVWKYTFGIKDQAAVMSVSLGDDTSEPTTEVVGFASDAAVSDYADRDHCAMFVQAIAPPPLVATSTTTFTYTSITSPDFAAVIAAGKVKKGMMIDTAESPVKRTGTVTSATGSTINVSAWYVVDGSRGMSLPANGTPVVLNPSTKVWAHNANVWLNANSHASNAVGFELGLFNFKAPDLGYLYDAINLGTYRGQGAFQCRGSWITGFCAYAGTQFGFVSDSASSIGYYSKGTTQFGFQSDGSSVAAVLAKNCSGQALLVQDRDGNGLTWIDGQGRVNRGKMYRRVFSHGQTIDDFVTYAHTPVLTTATAINLPAPGGLNTDRVLYVHNAAASSVTCFFVGSVEAGTGSVAVAPGVTRMLISDGTSWMG